MSDNIKTLVGLRKKALEAELLAREPVLMQEYIEASAAFSVIEKLGATHEGSSTEFTPYRSAIDAIEVYLDRAKEQVDQEVVINALLDGGYAPNYKRRRYNIKDSIRYHTMISKRLIVQDGKLGKTEWDTRPTKEVEK